jgi:phosphate/sulfate permease
MPVYGFAAEAAAGGAIELASRLGILHSTTHTISASIIGVGNTRRFSAVRWRRGSRHRHHLDSPNMRVIAWGVGNMAHQKFPTSTLSAIGGVKGSVIFGKG